VDVSITINIGKSKYNKKGRGDNQFPASEICLIIWFHHKGNDNISNNKRGKNS
jgi:hypothetical protein